jgi:hypothetical protein
MMITNMLGCHIAELPFPYLGIPLTVGRPTAAQLQPVMDNTTGMLPSWKSKLMNKAGRLAFVKSVPYPSTRSWRLNHQRRSSNSTRRYREVFYGKVKLKQPAETIM